LEKRKFLDSASSDQSTDQTYEIRIQTGPRSITIEDTGVGMDKQELIGLLGTIARSGSREFRDKDDTKASDIIGNDSPIYS
jgi:HSP90 family molecular chaperone